MTNVPFTRLQYHSKISAIFQDENKSLYSSCSNLPVQVNTQLKIVEMESRWAIPSQQLFELDKIFMVFAIKARGRNFIKVYFKKSMCFAKYPRDILVGRVGKIDFAKHNVQNYVNDFWKQWEAQHSLGSQVWPKYLGFLTVKTHNAMICIFQLMIKER